MRVRVMRKPYPFKHCVDVNDPDVHIKIMVDMPKPSNLTVHLSNEHRLGYEGKWPGTERLAIEHLEAHLFGVFRDGAEHYHVKGETF
jgi:hypothetical protein